MNRQIFKIGLVLAIQLIISVNSQGYGNIEDDSPAPSANNQQQQQQISSLPQYDPDPEGYGQQPESAPPPSNSNSQGNPGVSTDQGQSQDYWWQNQNAFQKPQGHPGVEPTDNSAAAPQQQPPTRPQSNQQQQPNKPRPQQPQQQQQQYRPNQPQSQPPRSPYQAPQQGSGWSGPSSQQPAAPASQSNFNLPPPSNSLAQPGNDFSPSFVAPECQLLNKADCHKKAPQPQAPYNAPPPQNYRPPSSQSAPRLQPVPQRNLPQLQPQTPPGFYQPPAPQPYDSYPQSPSPNNQNYQPQYSPESQPPQTSSFPQNPQRPVQQQQQPYRPQTPQQQPQQQQYNRPAPQQQNQYYQSQPQQPQQQQQQAAGGPVIGPVDDQAPYPGCPAAMLCVQDDQCNILGVVEDNLQLSLADKAHRVALSQCSEPSTGVHGICCRDPNYKDPWPDMNGSGYNSGQYQPQHHDKGSHNNQHHHHQQQQAPQPQSQETFRNPYSEFGERKKKSSPNPSSFSFPSNSVPFPNVNKETKKLVTPTTTTTATPTTTTTTTQKPEFQRCFRDEACVVHYKCENNSQRKKCRQDIFGNAFYCCKLSPSTTTTHPTIFTFATSRPLPPRNAAFIPSPTPTVDSIYINNPFLTDTFPPNNADDYEEIATSTVTTSNLVTGHGLRFHSHLHSQSAFEANLHKPNPYIKPAIVVDEEQEEEQEEEKATTIITTTLSPTINPSMSSNFSENSNSVLEPQSASSNLKISNQTTAIINENTTLPENYTEVYEPPANRTKEILQNFWNVDNYLNTTTTTENENSSSSNIKIVGDVVSTRRIPSPPKPVPLREELLENAPFGFIFKEYDLYIPESFIPAGFFQPPKFEYGERQYPIPEDFPTTTTTTTTEASITSTTEENNSTMPALLNISEGVDIPETIN